MDAILFEEWEAELARVYKADEGLTAKEIARQSNKPLRTTNKMLREGVSEGRYTVGIGTRLDSRGRTARVPVYRVKRKET